MHFERAGSTSWDCLPAIAGSVFLSGFLFEPVRSQEGFGFFLSFVFRPIEWRAVPENVFEVGVGTAIEQEADDIEVACGDGLMERCGMRVTANGVVAIGVFAGVEQGSDDFDATVLDG